MPKVATTVMAAMVAAAVGMAAVRAREDSTRLGLKYVAWM